MMRQRSGRTLNLRSTTHHHDARRRLQLRRQSTRAPPHRCRTAAATFALAAARLRHVLASATIASSLLPPTAPPPWPSQSPPRPPCRHVASTTSIDQGTAAAVACSPAPHTPAQPLPQPRTLACISHAHLTCEGLQAMVRGSVGGQREGVGTAAADEKAAHVAQQPAWGGHWPCACNQLCTRVCALQCGGGLVRRSSRPRAASGAGRAASPDGAGVALRRRARGEQ